MEACLLEAQRILSNTHPGETNPDSVQKCGFRLMSEIRRNRRRFSPEQVKLLESLLYRPQSQAALTSPAGWFKVHYDTTGQSAPSLQDEDHSGLPDYVEAAAQYADYVYGRMVLDMGFRAPPSDHTEGDEYDIYIRNISGYYGWTNPESPAGDERYTSYIEVDNDYSSTKTKGLDGLAVTLAHEFFHAVQLGYNARDNDGRGSFDDAFLMEAGSTWMEDALFDSVNDYYNYLGRFFERNNIRFDHADGWREYGLCLWFHYLTERYRDQFQLGGIVRAIWEEIPEYEAILAIDVALHKLGSSFSEELAVFYAWNTMTGGRADTSAAYPEGTFYPDLYLDGQFTWSRDTTVTDSLFPTACRYYGFQTGQDEDFVLVPVNVHSYLDEAESRFTMAAVQEPGSGGRYTGIKTGVFAGLAAEEPDLWECSCVVRKPGEPAEILTISRFSSGQEGPDHAEVPAGYPNPFFLRRHGAVRLPFRLENAAVVRLIIADAAGFVIWENQAYFQGGNQEWTWNGRDEGGAEVPTGVYLYAVVADGAVVRREKIAVIR
ncbi:hypothetical protein JW906_04380 [bacterium]|nr:hypothetical protein [bacterium]